MKLTKIKLREMIESELKLNEKTVRLSTMKDANFEPGQWVQILGKKGMVKLDKKSVHELAKIIRNMRGTHGMGWSFTAHENIDEKLESLFNESGIMYRAGVKKYGKEGMKKIQQAAGKRKGHEEIGKIKDKYDKTKKKKNEGKLTEASTVTLPNGVKVIIDFKGMTLKSRTSKPVFLDRGEMMTFFKATARYLK